MRSTIKRGPRTPGLIKQRARQSSNRAAAAVYRQLVKSSYSFLKASEQDRATPITGATSARQGFLMRARFFASRLATQLRSARA